MVSSDIQATSEEHILSKQLETFHWHEEVIGVNVKMLILVTIYGFILIISWVIQSGIWELYKIKEVFNKNCPQLNFYFSIPLAPKVPFRCITIYINSISIVHSL